MKQNIIKNKITHFAFVGLLGFNLFRPGINMDKEKDSTPTGSTKPRIETRIKNFKDSRGYLKQVKVTAVGTSTLTIDNAGVGVTINITDKTELRRRFWGKSSLAEFSVGDSVDVVGRWTDDTKTAINAVVIRNESIQKRFGVFFGTVKSLNGSGFVFTSIHRDDETVTIGTAKIVDRKGGILASADIKVGDRVRVRGMWDNTAKTITETVEIKDFNLPPRSPSATPVATSSPVPTPTATP